jgi:thiosulfate dehydrogenase [quinone] large subunit
MRPRAGRADQLTVHSIPESWRRQRWPLRILRAFLGGTFVYAGIQKLADPNFLHSGTPDYIGAQLQAFSRGSPVHPLLALASHVALFTGVVIALIELAVGIGTLAGIAPKTTASIGLSINLVLFLSATWHVSPYFLGSDSIYAVAWAAYLVGLIEAERRAERAIRTRGTRRSRAAAAAYREELRRRQFLRGTLVGVAAVALGASAFAVEGKERAVADPPFASEPAGSSSAAGTPSGPAPASIQGTPIATLDRLPVGGAVGFQDPQQGAAVLVRLAKDRVAAYSRVCTHAGCLVDYDRQSGLLVCPCHGAEFDPARHAEPVAGPAPTALPEISVVIDPHSGQVVAES